MGGIIIILAVIIPVLLLAKLQNVYVLLLLLSGLWMGAVGYLDDYIKIFKKNKDGLAGRYKIVGQVGIGIIVALVLFFNQKVLVRNYDEVVANDRVVEVLEESPNAYTDVKSFVTTIPFFKENEFYYDWLNPFDNEWFTGVIYVIMIVLVMAAVSNGMNITDGLDGLAAGTAAIITAVLAIFAYVSSNIIFSHYLNIMYIPDSEEVVIFCTALIGACVGFLWFNSYPAQVFMGDTGSLSVGAMIGVLAIVLRKELLLPLLCGTFLAESLSVMVQVAYFKYTKKKYGEGRRILLMAPLHHHYQKLEVPEPKIVVRFWVIGILLGILTLLTLKIR
jgi:phospho-N-acetylmuramoyl-pentapeptide-transferase